MGGKQHRDYKAHNASYETGILYLRINLHPKKY